MSVIFIVESMASMSAVEESFVEIDAVVDFVVLFIRIGVVYVEAVVSVDTVKTLHRIPPTITLSYRTNGDPFKNTLGGTEHI